MNSASRQLILLTSLYKQKHRVIFNPKLYLRCSFCVGPKLDEGTNAKNKNDDQSEDFLGIIRGEGVKDVVSDRKKSVNVVRKYERVIQKPRSEKVFVTNFGTIRYDGDNVPEYHGQFTPEEFETEKEAIYDQKHELKQINKILYEREVEDDVGNESEEGGRRKGEFLDGETQLVKKKDKSECLLSVENEKRTNIEEKGEKGNYFDEICFGELIESSEVAKDEKKEFSSIKNEDGNEKNEEKENYFDELCFGEIIESQSKVETKIEGKKPNIVSSPLKVEIEGENFTENTKTQRKEELSSEKQENDIYFKEICFGKENLPKKKSEATRDIENENFIDQMYFTNLVKPENEKISKNFENSPIKSEYLLQNVECTNEINFTAENYFENEDTSENEINKLSKIQQIKEIKINAQVKEKIKTTEVKDQILKTELNQNVEENNLTDEESQFEPLKFSPKAKIRIKKQVKDKEDSKNNLKSQFKFQTTKNEDDLSANKPKTASEYVSKLNQEKSNQAIEEGRVIPVVVDMYKLPQYEVLEILKENIIYNQNDIVAINKPYGLVCQEGKNQHHYVQKYLPDLAKFVDRDLKILHPVHRLDKGTTGVLLLAKTEKMASLLKGLFKNRGVQKFYWALTKGVPDPLEGIINIPVAEGLIENRRRMVLKPDINEVNKIVLKKTSSQSQEAITHYKVLSQHGNAALVELQAKTGVTHQVRVHLGFGLGCPILGDHKYSYISKLVPQKLPGDMLQILKIRQSKVRDLPIHLHARSVVIPEILEGRNIFIKAELPKHFRWAMQKLKLSKQQ